jgi:hypothetical protein
MLGAALSPRKGAWKHQPSGCAYRLTAVFRINDTPPKLFGRMAGTGKITGDIVNSLGEEWDAMKDDDSTTPFIGHALLGVDPKWTKR